MVPRVRVGSDTMKSFLFGMVVVAGSAACAQGAWGFKYQFLDTNTGQWSSNAAATVSGGNHVQFRVVGYVDANTSISATNGAGNAVAFCRLTAQEQMTNFGSVAGDAVMTSTKGALWLGHTSYTSTSVSGSTTYFGTNLVTSFAAQLLLSGALGSYCPSSGGVPQLEWVVRQGSIKLGGTGVRGLTFSNSVRSETLWYRDLMVGGVQDVYAGTPAGSPTGRGVTEYIPATDVVGTVTVTILDIPAPGAIMSLGVVALGACRRRR